jgi:hypothetical protein
MVEPWWPQFRGYRILSENRRKQTYPRHIRDMYDYMDTGALEQRSYGRRYYPNKQWHRTWQRYESDGNSRQLFQTRRAKRRLGPLEQDFKRLGYKEYMKEMERYDNDLYYAEDVASLAHQRWPQSHYK